MLLELQWIEQMRRVIEILRVGSDEQIQEQQKAINATTYMNWESASRRVWEQVLGVVALVDTDYAQGLVLLLLFLRCWQRLCVVTFLFLNTSSIRW